MKREAVVAEARKWLGKKWQHQARGPDAVDCIGLIQVVGDAFALEYEDIQGYARTPNGLHFLNHLRKYLVRVPLNTTNRLGCIAVFSQGKFPCHVGFFSERFGVDHIIHSRASAKKVVEEILQANNGFILTEILAFPGLED